MKERSEKEEEVKRRDSKEEDEGHNGAIKSEWK